MKNQMRLFLFLFILILLTSCVSRPEPIPEPEIEIEIIEPEPLNEFVYIEEIIEPEIIPLTPIEQLIERIKRNGEDIERYHILGRNGDIIVKADLQDDAGDFEIIYFLDEIQALDVSIYEVRFTARNIETDEVIEDTLIWQPVEGDAGILLSFDDSYVNTWIKYLDFFDMYGAKVTFFLQGGFDPFSRLALERGHDVGFHSVNHLDLRSLSAAAFTRETSGGAQVFRREGIPMPAFAYPYGFFQNWMNETLLQSFSILRGYGVAFRIYNKNEILSSYITSKSIDNTVIQNDDEFRRVIISMLRAVKFMDDCWVLPLTTHDISNAAWGIRPDRLEFVLSLTAELKLKFYRFCDFLEPADDRYE